MDAKDGVKLEARWTSSGSQKMRLGHLQSDQLYCALTLKTRQNYLKKKRE